jgi:hypothetical protein
LDVITLQNRAQAPVTMEGIEKAICDKFNELQSKLQVSISQHMNTVPLSNMHISSSSSVVASASVPSNSPTVYKTFVYPTK